MVDARHKHKYVNRKEIMYDNDFSRRLNTVMIKKQFNTYA